MAANIAAEMWSPMPDLRVRGGYGTKKSRRRKLQLSPVQLSQWVSFKAEVRAETSRRFGSPSGAAINPQPEVYIVGNEIGTSGRLAEHISRPLEPIFSQMGLVFGDPQAGKCGNKKSGRETPDITIQKAANPGKIRVVGEIKTPWTTRLSRMGPAELARLLGNNYKLYIFIDMHIILTYYVGQPARYMDDYGTRYGFITTYEESIFIVRTGPYRFKISPVIRHSTVSGDQPLDVSTRECLVFLASLANKPNWYFGKPIGPLVVSHKPAFMILVQAYNGTVD